MNEELYDKSAEEITVGAILKYPNAIDTISTILSEHDFYYSQNKLIYATALELHETSRLDFGTLKQWLREMNVMDQVGVEYLNELRYATTSLGLISHYAEKVREKAVKRRALKMAHEIEDITLNQEFKTVEEYVSAVSSKFNNLQISKKGNMVQVKDVAGAHIKSKLTGVVHNSPKLGLCTIDDWMNGIGRNRLIVVAGRPGTGKTAFSLKAARSIAKQEFGPAVMFSMEMEQSELMDRMIADMTGVPFSEIQRCSLGMVEKNSITQAESMLNELHFCIDDTPRMDIPYISAQCRKLKREHGQLGVIVIDYLGLLELHMQKNENKTDAIGRVTKECKNLAREIGCSVILLSQMNREIEKRATKRPVLSDLRESGNIEQDADMVIFLHRDDEKSSAAIAHIDFIVAKGRQTGLHDFTLNFFGQIQRMQVKLND